MPKLHIANTFFEWELENQPNVELSEGFAQHPIFRQLQFLPFLYATEEDGILLSDLPDSNYLKSLTTHPTVHSLSDSDFGEFNEIESWGPSRLIAAFAIKKGLEYSMPNWEVVRQVNSKRFSFECSPKLPHAALLTEDAQAHKWLRSFEGKKVLKTCYGVSGKGHLIIDDPSYPKERIDAFLNLEWKKELPVIAEPYVTRILDFSTQWLLGQDASVEYLGSTICSNDARGKYRFNIVGNEEEIFGQHLEFLKQHRRIVEPILDKLARLGFFGNVGVDAMLFAPGDNLQDVRLHPVVEINARKTMGWAALAFQRLHHPGKCIRFSFSNGPEGALPQSIVLKDGKNFPFRRNLQTEVIGIYI
jgi:hypothetical protein